jgi:hypothetical protein
MIVRELLAKFGVAYDDTGGRKADKDVEGLAGGFKALIGIVGGAALVRGMRQFIVQQVALADAVGDTAERLGIGVEALQELRFAGQDVGLSLDGVDAALGRLVRGASEAARGEGEAKDAFRELGVALTDGQGNLRSFDEVLTQVADGLGNTSNDADRLRLAYKIFGREGAAFASTMKEGSAGLEEMRLRARELGGVLSQEQVDAADKADKAIQGFTFALGGLKQQIASSFLPALTSGLDKMGRWVGGLKELVRNSSIVEATLATLGLAFATLLGGARLLMLGKAAVAFALIALAIDEIITTAKGGDTLIKRFVDALGGAGTTQATIDLLKEAWQGLNAAFAEPKGFINFLLEDYFGQLYRDGANLASAIERIGKAAATAGELVLKAFGFNTASAAIGLLRKTMDEDDTSDRATRGVGGTLISRDVDNTAAGEVARRVGRGVNSPLAATGQSATRGLAAEGIAAVPRAEAVATSSGGSPAGPFNLNQNFTVNVEGGGSDPRELARMIETRLRARENEANAQALRALRQVRP